MPVTINGKRQNMESLKKFVDDARARKWDDEKIQQSLQASGWKQVQIEAALEGLEVPQAPGTSTPEAPASTHAEHTAGRPNITALQAALQHVLLWLFTFTSSIMIGVVAFALFGANSGSSETLLTYLVMELVTFTPFVLLYVQYLRRLNREPDAMTGKVWSIITVVLHSVGLIGSLVSFVLVLILVHNEATTPGLIASGAIALMNALVVTAYVWANFAKTPDAGHRKLFLRAFPVLLFVLIASLGVVALLRVGSLRADDQTKQNLATTVSKIHEYSQDNGALPASLHDLSNVPDGVTYQRKNKTTYQVCATFKKDHSQGYGYNDYASDDSYVSAYDFDNVSAGYHCWSFKNSDLQYTQDQDSRQLEITGGEQLELNQN